MKRYALLHLSLLVYSLGGIAAKLASREPLFSFKFILFYGGLLGILFLYALIWQQILKQMPLNIAVANKSIIILWGALWGTLLFSEPITLPFLIGATMIVAGILLMVNPHAQ